MTDDVKEIADLALPADVIQRCLDLGSIYAFDAPDEAEADEGGLPCEDWAHRASRAILYDLSDRGGIKHGLRGIDEDVRAEIVATMTMIIRTAHLQEQSNG